MTIRKEKKLIDNLKLKASFINLMHVYGSHMEEITSMFICEFAISVITVRYCLNIMNSDIAISTKNQ